MLSMGQQQPDPSSSSGELAFAYDNNNPSESAASSRLLISAMLKHAEALDQQESATISSQPIPQPPQPSSSPQQVSQHAQVQAQAQAQVPAPLSISTTQDEIMVECNSPPPPPIEPEQPTTERLPPPKLFAHTHDSAVEVDRTEDDIWKVPPRMDSGGVPELPMQAELGRGREVRAGTVSGPMVVAMATEQAPVAVAADSPQQQQEVMGSGPTFHAPPAPPPPAPEHQNNFGGERRDRDTPVVPAGGASVKGGRGWQVKTAPVPVTAPPKQQTHTFHNVHPNVHHNQHQHHHQNHQNHHHAAAKPPPLKILPKLLPRSPNMRVSPIVSAKSPQVSPVRGSFM
ncbi:hypothetical protein HK102_011163, partial [Quaeritorhiza haematococci]